MSKAHSCRKAAERYRMVADYLDLAAKDYEADREDGSRAHLAQASLFLQSAQRALNGEPDPPLQRPVNTSAES